jgi:hypothetical protein
VAVAVKRLAWWVAALATGAAAAARSDPPGGREPVIVGGAGRSLADAVLVGRGGEIYRRGEAGWARAAPGGVGSPLLVAQGAAASDVWAMGRSAPPFHHDGASWNALPIAGRGPAVLGVGGALPAVAAGRRVLVLAPAAGGPTPRSGPPRPGPPGPGPPGSRSTGSRETRPRWTDLAPAPAAVSVLLAMGPRDVIVGTEDGRLLRLAGGWKKLPAPLAPGERVIGLCPGPGKTVVAVGSAGTLLAIDGLRARPIATATDLGAFRARLAAGGPRVVVLGEADGAVVLATLEKGRLVRLDPPPPIAPSDAVAALLVLDADQLLLATRSGTVLVRDADGSFAPSPLDDAPPAEAPHPQLPPAQVGP